MAVWMILGAVMMVGGAGTADTDTGPGTSAELPLVLYDECSNVEFMPFSPSGWMGSFELISVDNCWAQNPHSGQTCMRCEVAENGSWAGVAWLDPKNDWGYKPGGYDLSDAKKLTFWARGEEGGEKVRFKVAVIQDEKMPYPDTAREREEKVKLKDRWKEYRIWLRGDKSRVKSGFIWIVPDNGEKVTFYLDDVRYE
jgi:hypothetical protein